MGDGHEPHKNAVKVSFGAAVGDVAPVFVLLQLPEASEPVQHAHFELPGVHAVVALDEGIAEVVDGEVLQLAQCPVVQVQIVRVACGGPENRGS
ncbi:hypothetical protein C4D60_Mb10t19230 [Musa balbisiana]|uniref:Uncharacterized protein n=1 Tax=Musa balbisiana TaxID=52838 RepID=A0A4S8IY65_MUSBA|nr:hypothetical protein C4D60_Mb10t19230 [Musa balbisiana]